jgi:hypothetical protein
MPAEQVFRLDIWGRVDQRVLEQLRTELGLHRAGRLTDAEDAEFGYHDELVEDTGSRVHVTLWRAGQDYWQLVITHEGPRPPESLIDEWQARFQAAAEHARLRNMGAFREPLPKPRAAAPEPSAGPPAPWAADPPVARSSHEAHVFMDLHPCPSCGQTRFNRSSTVIGLPDGDLASRYAGDCPDCGTAREFVFRLPPRPHDVGGEFAYGGAEASQLLDAGEWLAVADRLASATPAEASAFTPAQRRAARARITYAAAAVAEVVKFVPAGQDQVPTSALWTDLGRAVHAREPGRFRTDRLAAVAQAYRSLASRYE